MIRLEFSASRRAVVAHLDRLAVISGLAAVALALLAWAGRDTPAARAQGRQIVAAGAKVERVAAGFEFTEGPVMDGRGGLLFDDIPRNRIHRYDPGDGKVTIFREPSFRANGLAFDAEGRLIACEGNSSDGGRRVTRTERDGRVAVLADRYQGKRLNSPNDLDVDRAGRIYFTDPRYGSRDGVEQDREAVYRIDPGGKLTRIIDDVDRPNGIAISPDGKTLYLADNHPDAGRGRTLLAYTLGADGRASARRVLHDFTPGRGVDGMSLDAEGNIYATAGSRDQAGVYVFTPAGKQLAFIPTPEDPTNCAFGGPDRKMLYITASKSLYRIKVEIAGYLIFPPAKR
jgi:gluconolactonase